MAPTASPARLAVSLGIPVLALTSGFAALLYEVLWLRELGLLFGNTVHAATAGLAVFFGGLSAGGLFWGRRAAVVRRPLLAYGLLEFGIAATAPLYFQLLPVYHDLLAPITSAVGRYPVLLVPAKVALTVSMLFLPAFVMGGTLPMLGQYVVRTSAALGRRGAILYAWNTLGAAMGALAAGAYLPASLGFRRTYLLAIAVNIGAGALALVLDTAHRDAVAKVAEPPVSPLPARAKARGTKSDAPSAHRRDLWTVAVASGFLTLGFEIAAMRLFAQILQNSVYTISAILTVFLIGLAGGAALAARLSSWTVRPRTVLAALLVLSGFAVACTPFTFFYLTDGMSYLGTGDGWAGYLGDVYTTVALVLMAPCVIAGLVFPFLLRVEQGASEPAGYTIGRLIAWNTIGAITGSAATGFLLLPAIGLWNTFRVLAAAYFVGSVALPRGASNAGLLARFAPLGGVALLFTALDPTRLPMTPANAGDERVIDLREGLYGVTSVVERGSDRLIKVNNRYSLGGTGAVEHQQNQALLPLMLHPRPQSIFFLGMGTGITAGAALQPGVGRVVVAELIPDVVKVAREHFESTTNGLFADPRVQIVTADGRNHLAVTRAQYDVIVADLFIPWEAGVGSLYAREHFEAVRAHLTAGGLFVQWLPLYQMSEREFMIVARTLLGVFPDVVVWRGDFLPAAPIVALVAGAPLPALDPARGREAVRARGAVNDTFEARLPSYMGNLAAARHLVPPGAVNTDDYPIFEFLAPITQREQRVGAKQWFASLELLAFGERLLDAVPPERDPYLVQLDASSRDKVRAGFHYYAAMVHKETGNAQAEDHHLRAFSRFIQTAQRSSSDEGPPTR